MNKIAKIILGGIVIILVLMMFRNRSQEKVTFSEDLSQVPQPSTIDSDQTNVVDFSRCSEEDNFSLVTGFGSGGLTVINADDAHCYVETRFELEGGFFINTCQVPVELGQIEFSGNNFEPISPYCQLKTEGSAVLDLDN